METEGLTQKIIGVAFKVHNALGAGCPEMVYENPLRVELRKQGLMVKHKRRFRSITKGRSWGIIMLI